MPKLSAGLLLYHIDRSNTLEVLLGHQGGPFWARKDAGAWSIPKGEYAAEEDPKQAAIREFTEELGGQPPTANGELALGDVKQSSGKIISVWAFEGDFDASNIRSNEFEMEWPPKSGIMQSFPEIDRAGWFPLRTAREKIAKGQLEFLDRLAVELRKTRSFNEETAKPEQASLF